MIESRDYAAAGGQININNKHIVMSSKIMQNSLNGPIHSTKNQGSQGGASRTRRF